LAARISTHLLTNSEPGAVATGYEASTPNQKRKALLARISQVQTYPVATAPGSELVDHYANAPH